MRRELGLRVHEPEGGPRDVARSLRTLTDGGADVVIDASGAPPALEAAPDMTIRGGRVALVGLPKEPPRLDPARQLVLYERSLIGSLGYAHDLPRAAAMIASGSLDPEPLVSREIEPGRAAGAARGDGRRTRGREGPRGAGGMSDVTVAIPMPHMGVSVTEGTVIAWYKAAGDSVEADELVCEISTDKVDTEVLAPAAGVIARLVAAEGETVAVGEPLAELAVSAEAAAAVATAVQAAAAEDVVEPPPAPTEPERVAPPQAAPARRVPATAEPKKFDPVAAAEALLPAASQQRSSRKLAGRPPGRERARHRPRRRDRQRDPRPHPQGRRARGRRGARGRAGGAGCGRPPAWLR